MGSERRRSTELYGQELAFGRGRVRLLRLSGVALVATGVVYLGWRPLALHGCGVLGALFFAAEAVAYLFSVLTVVLLWRPRWQARPPAAPFGSLDIFIPVCGEPVTIVARTLRAALAIDYRWKRIYLLNDGRRAGKPNWDEIDRLGVRMGVSVLTRTEGARGKAGNLNHAIARSEGDVIAVIDADHCAVESFANETLGYFSDPSVALVCSPQQFQTGADDPLNNRELLFYHLIQAAKDADNAAFSCGNAVLYRRSALEQIGGFSEWGVVEDLHTSYQLHAAGKRSVYHGRALTVGLAPETTAAYIKQRLTWATDGLRMFLWDNPLRKPGRLTLRQRLHYLHTTGFYAVAILQLFFLAGPCLYLLAGIPVMHPDSPAVYLAFGLPYYLSIAAYLLVAGGRRGSLGAVQSSLSLCPTYLLALARAVGARPHSTHVTAKASPPRFTPLLLPQQIIFGALLASFGVAIVRPSVGNAAAAVWAAYAALALTAVVSGLARGQRRRLLLRGGTRLSVLAVLGGALVLQLPTWAGRTPAQAALAQRPLPASASARPLVASGPEQLAVPARGLYLGVYNPDLLRRTDALRRWNAGHGVRASIAQSFQQWGSGERRFRADWASMLARQGAVPMITWEPWRKPANSVVAAVEPRYRLERIAGGAFDPYIRGWAHAAATYGHPILLRPMHEMNGDWYPWSIQTNGNSPRLYVLAWRRIVRIFRAEGATNVSFVWTINSFAGLPGAGAPLQDFYPGARYVDWVSATGFNWGTSHSWNTWRSFGQVFGPTYLALRRFHKPIMLSEVGTSSVGGNPAGWIRAAFDALPSDYPLVKAVVWFDSPYPGGVDFQLRGSSARAFKQAVTRRPGLLDPPLRFRDEDHRLLPLRRG